MFAPNLCEVVVGTAGCRYAGSGLDEVVSPLNGMFAPNLCEVVVGTVGCRYAGSGLDEVVSPLNSSSIPLPSPYGICGVSVGLYALRSVIAAVGTMRDAMVSNSLIR